MLLVQLLNYLQTTASIICIQRKHRIHCFPKQFSVFFFFFKCISSLFPPFILTLCALLSFDTGAFGKNIFLGHFKAFLILKYMLLRCSTFPSAEAPDFVYNLRRYSLIRINLGFTVFILVRFGLKGRGKGMGPSDLCFRRHGPQPIVLPFGVLS